jgi:hypothetical protein
MTFRRQHHFTVMFFVVAPGVSAFSPQGSTLSSLALHAKAAKKSSKSVPSAAGGFGGGKGVAKSASSIAPSDTAAFPDLHPDVAKTLLGFTGDNSKAQDLSSEMYERIAGIYGFRSFNYLMEEAPPMSLESLLQPSPIVSFADLLSSGNVGDGDGDSTDSKAIEEQVPLSNLPAFDKFRVLHIDPLVVAIDDFFTIDECDNYVQKSKGSALKNAFSPMESQSKTVGKDALAAAQRTSTTWFHHYRTVPELMSKASRLMGLDDITRWEEPQTVRYRRNEKFTWHLDALAPSEELERRGGQRVATLLVYLTDLAESEGGATMFRDLGGKSGPLRV